MDAQERAAEAIYGRAINRGLRVAVAASSEVPGSLLPKIAADSAISAVVESLQELSGDGREYVIAYLKGRTGGWVENYGDTEPQDYDEGRTTEEIASGGTVGSL